MLKQFLPGFIFLLSFSAANAQMYNAAYFYKSGIENKKNNKFPEALTDFTKAVSLKKNFDSAYVEMGNIYLNSNNAANSIINFKKALAINPKYTEAIAGMGRTYKNLKQNLDSGLFYYNAAVKLDSRNKEIFYELAWIYNAKKVYDTAIQYAVKALEIDNTYRAAYGELGHAYNASKQYAAAIEQFKKTLAVSVVDLALLYSGFCYTELHNKEAALQQYEDLKKVNEKMAVALKRKIDAMQ